MNSGKIAISLGIILIVQGFVLNNFVPLLYDSQGLEPQEKISIAHSDHFISVITKLNFITYEDSHKVSIYYNALPNDKNGFLAFVLPYDGSLVLTKEKWDSKRLTPTSTLLFTNVTCCVAEEDEFQFFIKGKLDSFKLPNHYIQLPFSNGASSEAVDAFYQIANGTSYSIGWDSSNTSVQLSLNKRFDERTTEPVARLGLVPNKVQGGNNNILNWNLDNGNTIFTAKYSDNFYRNFSEFRQIWIGISFGSGITMIAAGVALIRNETAIDALKRLVKVQRHMQDANTAFILKNYEIANQSYSLASKIDPKNIDPHLLAGNSFYEMKKYDEAIPYYEKVLKINPKYIAALNNIGACLAGLKKHDEAIEYYEQALEIDPNHRDSINNMGASILDIGFHDYAEPFFDESLKIYKKDVVALSNKARIFIQTKNYDNALNYCNNALEINSRHLLALTTKVLTLTGLERYDEVIPCCDIILKIDPNNPEGKFNKALALSRLGKYEDAIPLIDEYLANNPKRIEGLELKAECLDRIGTKKLTFNKTEALKLFKESLDYVNRALEIEPDAIELLNNKSALIGKLGDHQESLNLLNQILQKDPDNIDILMNKALALSDLGQTDDAITSGYDLILNIDKNHKLALERKARLLISIGKYKNAIENYVDKLLQIEKNNIEFLYLKANALRKNLQNEEALLYFDKILSLNPDDVVALNDKGLCLMNLESYQSAIDDCFDETLKIERKNIHALINKGACLYHLGKYEESIHDCYDRLLDFDGRNSQAWFNKAESLYKLGRTIEAMDCRKKSEKYTEIEERKKR